MYERFTDRARKVMAIANQEAIHFQHEYIGTEHILLGLVKEGTGVGANVLKNLGVNFRELQREVEGLIELGARMFGEDRLPHTPRAKKVIECAIEEARRLDHNYVGTEHLLLGLLRDEESVACTALRNQGIDLKAAREEVGNLLGSHIPFSDAASPGAASTRWTASSAPFPSDPVTALRELVRRFDVHQMSLMLIRNKHERQADVETAARFRDEAILTGDIKSDAMIRILLTSLPYRDDEKDDAVFKVRVLAQLILSVLASCPEFENKVPEPVRAIRKLIDED